MALFDVILLVDMFSYFFAAHACFISMNQDIMAGSEGKGMFLIDIQRICAQNHWFKMTVLLIQSMSYNQNACETNFRVLQKKPRQQFAVRTHETLQSFLGVSSWNAVSKNHPFDNGIFTSNIEEDLRKVCPPAVGVA